MIECSDQEQRVERVARQMHRAKGSTQGELSVRDMTAIEWTCLKTTREEKEHTGCKSSWRQEGCRGHNEIGTTLGRKDVMVSRRLGKPFDGVLVDGECEDGWLKDVGRVREG